MKDQQTCRNFQMSFRSKLVKEPPETKQLHNFEEAQAKFVSALASENPATCPYAPPELREPPFAHLELGGGQGVYLAGFQGIPKPSEKARKI